MVFDNKELGYGGDRNLVHKHVHHLPLPVSSLPPLLSLNSVARYYNHYLKYALNSLVSMNLSINHIFAYSIE